MLRAFDGINYERLLHKLANSGVGSINLLNWFHSSLADRRQRVVVNVSTSVSLLVCSRVPQG